MKISKGTLLIVGLILGLTVFFTSQIYFNTAQSAVLFCIVLMLFFWTTEALAMPITALLPVFVFSASGLMSLKQVLANYAHPVVYLFFGGFVLALGLQRWKIDVWLSQWIIKAIGSSPQRLLAGFGISTALLSMWISNTATAVMMLPLAQSILIHEKNKPVFTKLLYLTIAFAANIGGMATLIGTPPNIVLAALYKERYGVDISFAQWLQFGLPISILLLVMVYVYFLLILKKSGEASSLKLDVNQDIAPLNGPQKRFLAVFAFTALMWIFRPGIQELFQLDFLDDTFIALLGASLLFVIPGHPNTGERLLMWKNTQDLPWGILLIFGGGLSLALGIEVSGLSQLLGEALKAFSHWHLLYLMLLIAFFGLMATELMSNVALVSVFIPVVFLLSDGMDLAPYILAVPLTLAASCAFMLPIATPPNMVVYASGKVSFGDMARIGWRLNMFSLLLIVGFWYFLGTFFMG